MDNKEGNKHEGVTRETAEKIMKSRGIRESRKRKEMDNLMREINISVLIENKLFANKLALLSKQLRDGCDVTHVADELSKLSDDLLKLLK